MYRRISVVGAALLLASFEVGCGSSSSNSLASTIRQQVTKALRTGSQAGDRGIFVVNSYRIDTRLSGSANISFPGASEMDHDGPVGCPGQYFDIQTFMAFRYTAHDATLLYRNRLYHFGEPPTRHGGFLVWSANFGKDHVEAHVQCPLPPH
jgi:hypothetical protein